MTVTATGADPGFETTIPPARPSPEAVAGSTQAAAGTGVAAANATVWSCGPAVSTATRATTMPTPPADRTVIGPSTEGADVRCLPDLVARLGVIAGTGRSIARTSPAGTCSVSSIAADWLTGEEIVTLAARGPG